MHGLVCICNGFLAIDPILKYLLSFRLLCMDTFPFIINIFHLIVDPLESSDVFLYKHLHIVRMNRNPGLRQHDECISCHSHFQHPIQLYHS